MAREFLDNLYNTNRKVTSINFPRNESEVWQESIKPLSPQEADKLIPDINEYLENGFRKVLQYVSFNNNAVGRPPAIFLCSGNLNSLVGEVSRDSHAPRNESRSYGHFSISDYAIYLSIGEINELRNGDAQKREEAERVILEELIHAGTTYIKGNDLRVGLCHFKNAADSLEPAPFGIYSWDAHVVPVEESQGQSRVASYTSEVESEIAATEHITGLLVSMEFNKLFDSLFFNLINNENNDVVPIFGTKKYILDSIYKSRTGNSLAKICAEVLKRGTFEALDRKLINPINDELNRTPQIYPLAAALGLLTDRNLLILDMDSNEINKIFAKKKGR